MPAYDTSPPFSAVLPTARVSDGPHVLHVLVCRAVLGLPESEVGRRIPIEGSMTDEETEAVGLGEIGVALVRRERAARRELQDRERDDADREEERQRLQEPPDDVATHGAAAPLLLRLGYFFRNQSSTFQVKRCQVLAFQPLSFTLRESMSARS